MNTAKEYVHKLIDQLSEKDLPEILDYIEYIKSKKSLENYQDLLNASQSSISFWDNQTDDEVWNNV